MNQKHTPLLWIASLFFFVALLFARVIKPEWMWLVGVLGALLVASLGLILYLNRAQIRKDQAIRGASSLTTVVLVLCILGVLNFMASKYPKKLDLTANKAHTLSDQSLKALRGLKEPLRLAMFAKSEQMDDFRPLMDNIRSAKPDAEIEFVNPLKEAVRAQQAGLRSDAPTLQLTVGTRAQLIDAPNEEKVTNAILKLSKAQSPTLCNIVDHGERDFENGEPNGYSAAKEVLEKQSYVVKNVSLIKEKAIPADCKGIAILGPTSAFFPQEVQLIQKYLDGGGRAVIALDLSLKGTSPETSPELAKLLADWGVNAEAALIVDPISQAFQLEATMPLVATYSKDQAISKEMQGNSLFPFARPLTILKDLGPDVSVKWIAQSTPQSWGETNIKGMAKGTAEAGSDDLKGPLNVAVAIDGRRRGAPKDAAPAGTAHDSRIVVFGTSWISANQYSRFGNNLDLFANAVSWVLDDEGMISIRKSEAAGGQIQLSQQAAGIIFLVTVILVPFLLIVCGAAIWWYRKKL